MAGLDFADCSNHWVISPGSRRLLGIRHPETSQAGEYLFLPFGLGPAPGENDRSVKELLRVVLDAEPEVQMVDYVDDIRLTV